MQQVILAVGQEGVVMEGCLARPDILPVGDLAIRNAMRQTFGLRDLPKPDEIERIAAPWQPYRSIACHYLWCTIDSLP